MILSIIVAYAKNKNGQCVIGKNNTIPWHDPHDLIRFKEHTTGQAVIMGRKTFESIGKPLRERVNIIITRQKNYKVDGAHVFNYLQEALDFVAPKYSEVFIIGGQELYEQTMSRADRMYVTYIQKPDVEGDTFFPEWNRSLFKVIQVEKKEGKTEFEILQRIQAGKKAKTPTENPENITYDYHAEDFVI